MPNETKEAVQPAPGSQTKIDQPTTGVKVQVQSPGSEVQQQPFAMTGIRPVEFWCSDCGRKVVMSATSKEIEIPCCLKEGKTSKFTTTKFVKKQEEAPKK